MFAAVNAVQSLRLAVVDNRLFYFFELRFQFLDLRVYFGIALDGVGGGDAGQGFLSVRLFFRFNILVAVVGAVLREIAGAKLVFRGREIPLVYIFRYVQYKPSGLVDALFITRRAGTGGVRPQVVEREFFHRQVPGLLGGHLVNRQLEVVFHVFGRKKLLVCLIVDDGKPAAVQFIHPVDEPYQLNPFDVQVEPALQRNRQAEIGGVNLPEAL